MGMLFAFQWRGTDIAGWPVITAAVIAPIGGHIVKKNIVEGHGGTLRWESTPGVGTTFTARLPIKRAEDA